MIMISSLTPHERAIDIYNSHYTILFDSETDASEEILISILAMKHARFTVDKILASHVYYGEERPECVTYWHQVLTELDNLNK